MEGGGGGEVRARSGRRRITLLDQMSAIADGRDLSGLTLDDILLSRKQAVPAPPPPPEPPIQSGRTLLDIIRDEDPKASSCQEFVGNRDRKSWRSFKDRLRLKRTGSGAAWTSSVPIPASDILSPRIRSQLSRRGSVINSAESAHNMTNHDDTSPQPGFRQQISLSRRGSCRFGPNASFASDPTQTDGNSDNTNNNNNNHAPPLSQAPTLRHQISRRHSTRYSPVIEDSMTDPTDPPQPRREGSRRLSAVLAEERSLSAREAVAAQEAAEAAAAAAAATHEAESTAEAPAAAAPEAGQQPVRMSLMDLLEETDRQMGFVGSRYMIGDDEEEDYEEEEEGEEDAVGGGGVGAGGVEQNCCVCMVRHKGAAFIPCGHTFCRLCSRELWVSRGNCPLCNGFILEILDIF